MDRRDSGCFLKNSRCGSVTFWGKQRTVLFSNSLRPLRSPANFHRVIFRAKAGTLYGFAKAF